MLGKTEGKRRRGQQRWTASAKSMDTNLSKLRETVEERGAWHAAVHEMAQSQTRLSNWKTATSLTTISRCWAFLGLSGESLTTLPTVQNTKYHVCSYFSSLGWIVKNIGMYFYDNFIFKHLSLQSQDWTELAVHSTGSFRYFERE